MKMTMTDSDDVGKLFVGGLSWETTQQNLQSYFSRFGEIVDCVVMKNNETGRSRGFGFVTFKDPNCVAAVLQVRPHQLNGRTIDAKECTPRSMQRKRNAPPAKIFLGGLPPDITESAVRNAMSRFGNVTQVLIMYDSETKKCRGFGFLSFESEESIEKACAEHFVIINGKQIECKRAQPRDEYRRNSAQPSNYSNGRNAFNPPSFGAVNDYQRNWNAPPEPSYNMPGNTYGGYQSYNPPIGGEAAGYSSSSAPYSSLAESQYSMSSYTPYGAASTGMASYYSAPAPAPPPVNNYSQPSSATYSQSSSSYPGVTAPPVGGGSYDGYTQDSSSYGSAKPYGGAKMAGASYVSPVSKGQGYHPYRR